jgi:hypothetical protein
VFWVRILKVQMWIPKRKLEQTSDQIQVLNLNKYSNTSANKDFFAVFRTRLTNMDSANKCFSGCAR